MESARLEKEHSELEEALAIANRLVSTKFLYHTLILLTMFYV